MIEIQKKILKKVLVNFDLTEKELRGKSRRGNFPDARKAFAIADRKINRTQYRVIGDFLNRDHSTVIYMVKDGLDYCSTDRIFRDKVKDVLSVDPFNEIREGISVSDMMNCLSLSSDIFGTKSIDVKKTENNFDVLLKIGK